MEDQGQSVETQTVRRQMWSEIVMDQQLQTKCWQRCKGRIGQREGCSILVVVVVVVMGVDVDVCTPGKEEYQAPSAAVTCWIIYMEASKTIWHQQQQFLVYGLARQASVRAPMSRKPSDWARAQVDWRR